jgi:hypothetical protein
MGGPDGWLGAVRLTGGGVAVARGGGGAVCVLRTGDVLRVLMTGALRARW